MVSACEWFKSKVSPHSFTRMALLVCGVWFLAEYPALNWLCPDQLDSVASSNFSCDFGQYYTGAIVANTGMWDCLYPVPKPEVYNNPPQFTPIYKTCLFDAQNSNGKACYYPTIASPKASRIAPKLLKAYPNLQRDAYWHYMYPPPLALLLWPLGLFDFDTGAYHIWPTLTIAAFFGIAFFSMRMHRLLRGQASYAEGLIALATLGFSFSNHTSIDYGNVTPILGFLIAFATYSWMRERQIGVGTAMIPLLLFKGIGLTWCPLLLLRQIRWKTLLTLAFFTVLLNGIVLFLAGTAVYRQYFTEILPRLETPVGWGVVSEVLRLFGIYPRNVYLCLNLALCGCIYYGYWRGRHATSDPTRHSAVAAAMAGTVAVFCLLNIAVWDHYFPGYLYFPFLGWLAWEGLQARGKWRFAILSGTALCFAVMIGDGMMIRALVGIFGEKGGRAFTSGISIPCFAFYFPVFFLIVAFRRLYAMPPVRLLAGGEERGGRL